MPHKKTTLKPSSKGRKSPWEFARRAREINERLAAQDRHSSDSTEIIRRDRGSR